ncbi:pentatricopeptide repeat-containing protein mitochondrial-like [Dorcoceras hygrometricum]|uniref:Pentatricopeptide repeat-containing protein mitochondrial-like n=1 Tax=Dorcoceras hygrometricum TaxID=472368 RepID=A0A2Z7A6B7_9LAMI|nr:pentatricopeptide repeat-containing protein mitochondrial-like [Dorcoceras hygrometricum]
MLAGRWMLEDLKTLLLTCKDRGCVPKIHAVLITFGLFSNRFLASQLVSLYARVGNVNLARKLFDSLPKRGVESWNALIVAYSRENLQHEVVSLYQAMGFHGVKPDSSTFTMAIKACTGLMDLELGNKIWREAVDCGYEHDIFVCSSVLNLYAKCGRMNEATCVFERMRRKDVVSWSTVITGFVKIGKVNEALGTYRRMCEEGFDGDRVVMLSLIQACSNMEDLKMASSLHGYMIRRDFPVDVILQTSLVDMYAKNGEMGIASILFRTMSCRNMVSWSTLIFGYAQNGLSRNALESIIEMQSCGFEPDLVSLVGALLACSQVGSLIFGRAIHGYIARRFDVNQILATSLVDMYAKCGSLSSARVLFDRMNMGDVILWNTIITSYGNHGHGEEALSLFHQMIKTNTKPDDATFASLLSALSHTGLVEEGKHLFDIMIKEFKVQPTEKHHVCLIDLLARAGQVEVAWKLIDSMACEPGIAVWVALLSGCLNNKKYFVGELAAKKVLELNPDSPGIYSLVSNFFSAAKKWDEVSKLRKLIKRERLKKEPGYSVVEVRGRLHSFLADQKCHPQYQRILGVLEEMEFEMRAIGYVPSANIQLEVEVL